MRHFFITGRPRSRTAWIANYLTWGDTFCFHDALRTVDEPRLISRVFARASHASVVGLADPAILFFQDALRAAYPDAAWIFIDRDPRETVPAFEHATGRPSPAAAAAAIERHVTRLLAQPGVLRVPFTQLDAFAPSLGRIVRGSEWSCPPERLAELSRQQVQIHPEAMAEGLRAGMSHRLLEHVER